MYVYGELKNADLENKSSDPSAGIIGRIYWNTVTLKAMIDDGTNIYAFLRNDAKAIIGNNGTANNNIRFHRGAASVLQFVQGGDSTAEGTLSTSLAQISAKMEGYATGAIPAAGNGGRIVFDSTLSRLKFDTGAAWFNLSPMTTNGDITFYNSGPTRLAKGTDGQVLTLDGGLPAWKDTVSPTSPSDLQNLGLAVSVAANALTVALKQYDGSTDPSAGSPVKIGFRSATATSGAYSQVTATAATSLTVPDTATLGTLNGVQAQLWVYALNNAGTIELAISHTQFDTGTILSSTTIGTGADSNAVIYSTTGRSNVAMRVIGRITITEATAGTWATAPSVVVLDPAALLETDTVAMLYKGQPTGTLTNSLNKATLPTRVVDTHGIYSSGSATIPIGGIYNISGQLAVSYTAGAGVFSGIGININASSGVYQKYVQSGAASQASDYFDISADGVQLAAGDVVFLESYCDGASPTFQANAAYSRFSIVRVGP